MTVMQPQRVCTKSLLLQVSGRREGKSGESFGFGGADAEQPQAGFGEFVHGALLDLFRVALTQPQQPEQPAGYGAERDLSVRDGELAAAWPA